MEEGWGQAPSQPSNFVSLLHLRERWLTQNHPNKHQHELQLQPAQPEGKIDQPPEDAKPPPILTTSWSRKFPAYHRAVPVSSRPCNKSVDEAEPLLLVQSDEKKTESNFKKKKPKSHSDDVRAQSLLSGEKTTKSNNNKKKEPRSHSEDVESDGKKKQSMEKHPVKNKPRSQSEDVGEALPAVSSIESREKKKQSRRKHLMEKKPRSALLADPPIKSDDKKKKSKRNRGRKKPVSQSLEMDTTPPTPEENLKEEMSETECEVAKQNEKRDVRTSPMPEVNLKKGMRGQEREVRRAQSEKKYVWARKIDEKKGVETQCGSGTANTNARKEIENKLSRISVSFESKRGTNNGVYKGSSQGNQNIRGHRNLRRLAPRKQMDAGMIWVRKDELPIGA